MIVTNISYTYDANGMRASKTVNGVKSTFEYVGGKLVYEKRGNMDIYYQYDSNGNLSAIRYVDGTEDNIYYTVCNSRGDVEAIYGGGGGLKARYIYDTWGNTVKIVDVNGNEITDKNTVGYINPIRYRGYYYDAETGFYYLQSRYYDPETGRFLNADGYVSTGSGVLDTNMFAYCGNNPVNNSDPTGFFFSELWETVKNIGNQIVQTIESLAPSYSSCNNLAAADGPAPIGDIAALTAMAVLTVGAIGYGVYKGVTKPYSKSISKAETKEKSIPVSPPRKRGTTYYHVTTRENAVSIMTSGVMKGSKWESGYVYAWCKKPSKKAKEMSGARFGTIISFKTSVSFIKDTGIEDQKLADKYGAVVSVCPGPIVVWDVQIVG